jgi:hypothetical protein
MDTFNVQLKTVYFPSDAFAAYYDITGRKACWKNRYWVSKLR